jgi:hypothetical protein
MREDATAAKNAQSGRKAVSDAYKTQKAARDAAQREADLRSALAQKRIDTIKGRRKAISKGAAGALGLGIAYNYGGTLRDVLSGR